MIYWEKICKLNISYFTFNQLIEDDKFSSFFNNCFRSAADMLETAKRVFQIKFLLHLTRIFLSFSEFVMRLFMLQSDFFIRRKRGIWFLNWAGRRGFEWTKFLITKLKISQKFYKKIKKSSNFRFEKILSHPNTKHPPTQKANAKNEKS